MNVQSSIENGIAKSGAAPLAGDLDAVCNFAISIGGVKKGDVVAEISACSGSYTRRLRQLGAQVVKVAPRESQSGNPFAMANASVDVIFTSMVLHHMKFPGMTIAEMKRMLRPGGRLVITDRVKYGQGYSKYGHPHYWVGFYTSDIRHWLKSAGFSNIIVNPVPCQLFGFDVRQSKADKPADIFMATGTA